MKYISIFHEEKVMPFDHDEGGNSATFSEIILNHDPIVLYRNTEDMKQIALWFERVQSNPETVN